MDLSQDLLKFKCICFDHNRANVFTSESILLYEVSGFLANFRQSSAVNNVDRDGIRLESCQTEDGAELEIYDPIDAVFLDVVATGNGRARLRADGSDGVSLSLEGTTVRTAEGSLMLEIMVVTL